MRSSLNIRPFIAALASALALSACNGVESLQKDKSSTKSAEDERNASDAKFEVTNSIPFVADRNIPNNGKPVLVKYVVDSDDVRLALSAELLQLSARCIAERKLSNFAVLVQSLYLSQQKIHLCKDGNYSLVNFALPAPSEDKKESPFTDVAVFREAMYRLQSEDAFFKYSETNPYHMYLIVKGHGAKSFIITDLKKDLAEAKIQNLLLEKRILSPEELQKLKYLSDLQIGLISQKMISLLEQKELAFLLNKAGLLWADKRRRTSNDFAVLLEQRGLNNATVQGGLNNGTVQGGLNNGTINGGLNNGTVNGGLNSATVQGGLNSSTVQGGLNSSDIFGGLNSSAAGSGLGSEAALKGLTIKEFYDSLASVVDRLSTEQQRDARFMFIAVESCFSSLFAKKARGMWEIFAGTDTFFRSLRSAYGYYASRGIMDYRNFDYDVVMGGEDNKTTFARMFEYSKEAKIRVERPEAGPPQAQPQQG